VKGGLHAYVDRSDERNAVLFVLLGAIRLAEAGGEALARSGAAAEPIPGEEPCGFDDVLLGQIALAHGLLAALSGRSAPAPDGAGPAAAERLDLGDLLR
jgi:hypothetical protein